MLSIGSPLFAGNNQDYSCKVFRHLDFAEVDSIFVHLIERRQLAQSSHMPVCARSLVNTASEQSVART